MGTFIYKATTPWRMGENTEMAIYDGATAFLLWSAGRTIQEIQAI